MWRYSQSTGYLTTAEGFNLEPAGYAGKGPHKNNPFDQELKNLGPLPRGFYTMSALIELDSATGHTPSSSHRMRQTKCSGATTSGYTAIRSSNPAKPRTDASYKPSRTASGHGFPSITDSK